MINALSTALSGMNAAQSELNATAHNIANAETPGFKAVRVDRVSLSGGGVATRGSVDPAAGPVDGDGREGSNVDLATESVNLVRAQALYTANAVVVKTADRMLGTLLDVVHDDERGRRRP
jgi:flagellar basal-body rod protein FlgC